MREPVHPGDFKQLLRNVRTGRAAVESLPRARTTNGAPTTPMERPFEMDDIDVRATLRDAKTVLRQPIRPDWFRCLDPEDPEDMPQILAQCPYGVPGARLSVTEAWNLKGLAWNLLNSGDVDSAVRIAAPEARLYRATHKDPWIGGWCPAKSMPRALSRITLEIVSVRVERLHSITANDVKAEGIEVPDVDYTVGDHPDVLDAEREAFARKAFAERWNAVHGRRRGASWTANPHVFRVEYRRIKP